MVRFHKTLSDRTVYLRYFCWLSFAARTDHARLSRICLADGVREIVLAALSGAPGSHEQTIVGVGRLNVAENGGQAELAVLIADEYQGRGLGKELVGRLIIRARLNVRNTSGQSKTLQILEARPQLRFQNRPRIPPLFGL
jgi:acetyltransferase